MVEQVRLVQLEAVTNVLIRQLVWNYLPHGHEHLANHLYLAQLVLFGLGRIPYLGVLPPACRSIGCPHCSILQIHLDPVRPPFLLVHMFHHGKTMWRVNTYGNGTGIPLGQNGSHLLTNKFLESADVLRPLLPCPLFA